MEPRVTREGRSRMAFTSFAFLFIFLPVALVTYQLVPARWRNGVITAASLAFYAWGGLRCVALLVAETLVSWVCGLFMRGTAKEGTRRTVCAVGCIAILAILAYFRCAGAFVWAVNAFGGEIDPALVPVLPLGMSIYSLRLISYLVDVKRGTVPGQRSFFKLLLFASLFHLGVAGPLVRYGEIERGLDHRNVTATDIYLGVRRFSCGLAKKALLANSCGAVADSLLPVGALAAQSVSGYWLGMAFYTLQVYLDLSAYADMAIGLGRMVGFRYPENFDHPYQAASIREFWHKWHITLVLFLRDYVYVPLGGGRISKRRTLANMALMWLLMGIWHGAGWNFVVWGAYNFALIQFEHLVVRDRLPRPVSHVLTLLAVLVGWTFFRFADPRDVGQVLLGMVGIGAEGLTSLSVRTSLLQHVFLLAVSAIACTNLGSVAHRSLGLKARTSETAFAVYSIGEMILPVVLVVLSVLALAGASYNPLIYFRF